ncbi:Mu transposase C-terminal domain-containing protein [Mycobacteroides abscessus]|uniref:Mu transposase C-terminal domain-containing protein n=1 Tax=Mycobacteroides abscessus TaxID=36809 RepID=UPI00078B4A2D|nr:Mu transposase C-terminal domain-containing protein [Mycobacteroides abscessus]AMU23408.1 transposase [Mycobacteroides abscessus]RIS88676.1 transposase [Mycobacteroides abscessus]SIA30832.1 integrase family protein [Mycobacteroides abscessus subsp. bolletii]SIA79246.1 integrase family protein [Mycobacteroides abscessus subsp. bolletii]SII54500.1 integrase family protein [Mycobacteroides abscessus subsp. abscessus]
MSNSAVRVGVGTRVVFDGELLEVAELHAGQLGTETVLRSCRGQSGFVRIALHELLTSRRASLVADTHGGGGPDDAGEPADVVLSAISESERAIIAERAAHVREVLTGYRSGAEELAAPDEPRPSYDVRLALTERYTAKAAELEVSLRTIKQWVADFRQHGEAGLARSAVSRQKPLGLVDERWVETALEVMVEHTEQSRPSRLMVIDRTNARVVARYGPDAVKQPSRATAYRILEQLENRHPTFRLSTKRNRDIADRPDGAYGKLRPTRPGEYLLMDTTRLDVFALDPITLRWVQAELTIGMDWYTRCVTGIRITPVSTKSVDAASVLYQVYRPRPAGKDWPAQAVWPEHGVPRSVLIDIDAVERPGVAGPAIVPETIVIDHGKIYVSEHLTSVCQRMGISIQPARLRTGRDKGPVERFFRTIREDLLQVLPGYKGPDVHSRGLDPEAEAFFYLDELETIIREWVAVVYHRRPHDSLIDPHVPGFRMSPAQMFEHGVARAGYVEVPRDPDLAYEFLKTEFRKIQHYGVDFGGRRYNGPALNAYRNLTSPYKGKAKGRWPIHYDPDNVTRVYFRDPETREWHTLMWEHAPSLEMPLSEDALQFARKLAASKYTYPDDRLAVADLLERWNLGLGSTLAERRMALRLSRDATLSDETETQGEVVTLPSVARVLATADPPVAEDPDEMTQEPDPEAGDDDAEDEFDDYATDFYAEALDDA